MAEQETQTLVELIFKDGEISRASNGERTFATPINFPFTINYRSESSIDPIGAKDVFMRNLLDRMGRDFPQLSKEVNAYVMGERKVVFTDKPPDTRDPFIWQAAVQLYKIEEGN